MPCHTALQGKEVDVVRGSSSVTDAPFPFRTMLEKSLTSMEDMFSADF
jgi:hypothetical protein